MSLGSRLETLLTEVLRLVSIELYSVKGVLEGDRLLVTALREGALNAYAYKPEEGLVKLNRMPISMVAEPPYGASRIVLVRDVAGGRELHALYTVDLRTPGEENPLARDLKPMRVLGVVDKVDRVYVTGVLESVVGVIEATPDGGWRKAGMVPGLGALADAQGTLGVGLHFTPTGRTQLFLMDLESGETSIPRLPEGSVVDARFSPGGEIVYALEKGGKVELRRLDTEGRDLGPLTLPESDLSKYGPTSVSHMHFTPEGRLIIVAGKEGRSRVFLDGKHLRGPAGMYGLAYKLADGVVASYSSLRTPSRLLFLGVDGGHRVLLSGSLPGELGEVLGEPEFHWVESTDGSRVPTFVLPSGRAGRPGPTVVLVHGGPFSEDKDSWSVFAAALALTGFNVVMPNYRGSTGYGEDWRRRIIGDLCGKELEDIVSASRWAKSSGLASYTVIMGYSYGGYATMCALTRVPDEFEAGVAGASVVDWEEMYELSDPAFKQFIEILFGGRRDLWAERSPINHVDNLVKPLCIIHPQNDTRTPLKPVLRFMHLALEKGKSFEAHISPDMGHAVNTIDDIIKILLPAILFLARLRENRGQLGQGVSSS